MKNKVLISPYGSENKSPKGLYTIVSGLYDVRSPNGNENLLS